MKHEMTRSRILMYAKTILISYGFMFLFVFFGVVPGVARAAELKLSSPISELSVNQQFKIDLIVDTEGESVNAFSGKIIFPGDLLEVKNIVDGNSIINFWIEKPVRVVSCSVSCELVFSGITPGGYVGKGFIFSIIFQTKKEGPTIIKINNAKTYLNDGKGTETAAAVSDLKIIVSGLASPVPSISEIIDKDPPEPFSPLVGKETGVFDRKYFLVFSAQDKKSGIDYYEVLERREYKIQNLIKQIIRKIASSGLYSLNSANWIKTESPYILKDQDLRSYIYVKAVDKAGNQRIAVVEPRYPMKWYEIQWIWGIIGIGMLIIYLIGRILWKKYTKQH